MAPSSTKDLSLPNYFKQEGSDELRSLAVTEFSLGLTSLTQVIQSLRLYLKELPAL
jgi:hypothetical protein